MLADMILTTVVSTRSTTRATYDDLPRLMSLMTGDEKHNAAATSTLDVLWVLYDRVLDVSPETIGDPGRDRFYLSKGHGPMAYYAILAAKGFLPEAWLADWASYDSPLGRHPDRVLVPGVEISSGSLGHGLPLAVGTALGLRAQGLGSRVVVLVGDAELDEGSNAEAIQLAGALALDNLTVVVVDNASTSYHRPRAIAPRFAHEGWAAAVVDGRDHRALEAALTRRAEDRPAVVVAEVEEK
jgi:transketolase